MWEDRRVDLAQRGTKCWLHFRHALLHENIKSFIDEAMARNA